MRHDARLPPGHAPRRQPQARLPAGRPPAIRLHPGVLPAGDTRHHAGRPQPQVPRHPHDTLAGAVLCVAFVSLMYATADWNSGRVFAPQS